MPARRFLLPQLPPKYKARISQFMRRGSTGVVMQPVVSGGHWRVQMTWPRKAPRYFGKFNSLAEAERWIAGHRWLTKPNLERQVSRLNND